ncbi:N-formylglutamate amidohydrolase [Lewinella sp. IMCC34191]|uniref:N-formylglutamate amidohydrolase n=1 Tax=Lewinella sp. IMCC34191 TaxID=2259172 RepID=UPI000E255BBF|nr:N-formylglutamate amidohydrolase [Lewinella sp. IMCC34191]
MQDQSGYFTITGAPAPLVLTAIHDGAAVREALQDRFALDELERRYEEDPHTATWARLREPHIVGLHSRFEVDLNRSRDSAVYLEPADAWGLNVWRHRPDSAMVDRSLSAYDNFYQEVEGFLQSVVDRFGSFVLYDIHSYNHRREENDRMPADPEANPVVNVGTGNMDRERWAPVVEVFMESMRAHGLNGEPLDVRENVKFPGGHFNHWLHDRFPGVSCVLSIEFKKIFMDEHTNEVHTSVLQQLQEALVGTFDPVLSARARVNESLQA